MRSGRYRERLSWSKDPKLDRKIKKSILRNNIFAIVVIVIIIGSLLFK